MDSQAVATYGRPRGSCQLQLVVNLRPLPAAYHYDQVRERLLHDIDKLCQAGTRYALLTQFPQCLHNKTVGCAEYRRPALNAGVLHCSVNWLVRELSKIETGTDLHTKPMDN